MICGVVFGIYSIPFFLAFFLSVSLAVLIDGMGRTLPVVLLSQSISEIAAYGVSGFLMSLIVIFISRSRQMKVVVFAAVTVAVCFVVLDESIIFLYSLPLFYKVYLLSKAILDVIFLLGFSIFGAWLLTKRNRLKMQEGEKYVQ